MKLKLKIFITIFLLSCIIDWIVADSEKNCKARQTLFGQI